MSKKQAGKSDSPDLFAAATYFFKQDQNRDKIKYARNKDGAETSVVRTQDGSFFLLSGKNEPSLCGGESKTIKRTRRHTGITYLMKRLKPGRRITVEELKISMKYYTNMGGFFYALNKAGDVYLFYPDCGIDLLAYMQVLWREEAPEDQKNLLSFQLDMLIHTVKVCLKTLEAVQSLHSMGALHRDIKPENVAISRPGSPTTVVNLIDFGHAGIMDENKQCHTTRTAGTPGYRGEGQYILPSTKAEDGSIVYRYTPRNDLFALGMTINALVDGTIFELKTSFKMTSLSLLFNLLKKMTTKAEDCITLDEAIGELTRLTKIYIHIRDCTKALVTMPGYYAVSNPSLAKAIDGIFKETKSLDKSIATGQISARFLAMKQMVEQQVSHSTQPSC